MAISNRPLTLVVEITRAAGLDVVYEYDDLVFVSHNVFIFRFTDSGERVELVFNRDCEPEAAERFTETLTAEAGKRGVTLERSGYYALSQGDEENMTLEFFDTVPT